MESARFDALARIIGEASRRGLLRTVLGSATATALATVGLARGDAAAAGRACKSACGTCQQCKKGKCKKKNGRKTCKKGICRPQEAGTPCADGVCCGAESGGGCCTALADCCVTNGDCEMVAVCNNGCCFLI